MQKKKMRKQKIGVLKQFFVKENKILALEVKSYHPKNVLKPFHVFFWPRK